jgi:GNAT superfamily N-acetyltransferase
MEGIYLLCSKNTDGQFVYKVGRSGDINRRIKDYPPNFEVLLQRSCSESKEIEKKILDCFNTNKDLGLVKYEKGNEYFKSITNINDRLKGEVCRIILNKKLVNSFYNNVITFKRCLTNEDCELFLEFMVSGDEELIKTIKKKFNTRCNHHWYYILLDNKIIGTFILGCGYCPNTSLEVLYIDILEHERRRGFGSKVLQMIEREFFWDKKQMVVSEMFYMNNKEFLEKNGFILTLKLRDLHICDYSEIKTVPLTFRWINTFSIEDFGDSKYYEDKIITGTYGRRPSFLYTEELEEFTKRISELFTLYKFTEREDIDKAREQIRSIYDYEMHKDVNVHINDLKKLIEERKISTTFEYYLKILTGVDKVDYEKILSNETLEGLAVKLFVLHFSVEEIKTYNKDYDELNVQISESWTHVITEYDGGFALLHGNEYLIKPIRYKYLHKKWRDVFQLISTDLYNKDIVRIDKISIAGMNKMNY